MSDWVLNVALGPVGRFIGAGRRSRDLWWGSTWLSECSLAVAKVLHVAEGLALIPSRDRVKKLRMRTRQDQYGDRISNHLLLVIQASSADELKSLVERAERAARDHLVELLNRNAQRADRRAAGLLRPPSLSRQIEAISNGDFLEFYAVWTPVNDGGLRKALARAEELMDARKSARLFVSPQWQSPEWQDADFRKSDLDAGRPTVLREARDAEHGGRDRAHVQGLRELRARLGISPGEHLDAVGLARRLACFEDTNGAPRLVPLPFPPLSRVAVDPWLHGAARRATKELASLREALCDRENDDNFSVWCSKARDPETSANESALFPYDASLLLEGGLDALQQELGRTTQQGSLDLVIRDLRGPVEGLHEAMGGPPQGYVALLSMDGDEVGNALHAAAHLGKEALEKLTDALDQFAERAPDILSKSHNGCAFYAAGDELLAFLPVDKALGAATALAGAFAPVVEMVLKLRLQDERGPLSVSLSGGLVIAHLKHDLRDLRAHAQEALDGAKRARRQRDCAQGWLEVRELPRSGVERSCRGPLTKIGAALDCWSDGIEQKKLSMRTAEKILDHAERFEDPKAADLGSLGVELLKSALESQERRGERAWAAEHGAVADVPDGDGPKPHPAQRALAQRVVDLGSWHQARALAAELQIARRLARVAAQRSDSGGGAP